MDEELKIEFSSYGKYRLLRFPEQTRLVLYNCTDLKDIFKTGNEEKVIDWILDLSNVEYIDSSGLAIMTNQSIYLKKVSGRLTLLSPKKGVKQLLDFGGFTTLFDMIYDLSDLK